MLPTLCTHISREYDPQEKTEKSEVVNSDINFMALCADSDELEEVIIVRFNVAVESHPAALVVL